MEILNKRIIKGLIKEESETAVRYRNLGIKYNIPGLVQAGNDEARHAAMFRQLIAIWKE